MCGRYTSTNPARLRAAFPRFRFGGATADAVPRYNIAPSQPVLATRNDGRNDVETMTWGFGAKLINARAETITEKPAFRDALRQRRCVIFADGFYEWRDRTPIRFTLEDERPFAFAGLWQSEPGGTIACTIVTCEANATVRPVHHRMPVILANGDLEPWLTTGNGDTGALLPLLRPYPAESTIAREASRRMNDPRYDHADALRPDESIQTSLELG
jgi:putative SOS response-associated peptidase YedK